MVQFLLGFVLAILLCLLVIGYLSMSGYLNFNNEESGESEETTEGFRQSYDPERLLTQLLQK